MSAKDRHWYGYVISAEQLAAAFRKSRPVNVNGLRYLQWTTDLQALVGALKADNPQFDADRFYRAASKE